MLKSTYKPSAAAAAAAAAAPLPPGWTEHRAPTGHSYYYNAETKESTYKRPGLPDAQPTPEPAIAYTPYPNVPNLADPNAANAYLAQFNPQPQSFHRGGYGGGRGGRGGFDGRPRPQPIDKPRRKEAIPGCEPWILVYTKYSRRFVYNPVKNASYWRIPEKLMPGILELDKARIRNKATGEEDGNRKATEEKKDEAQKETQAHDPHAADGSEYEEVEVTDDEDGGDELDGEHPSKRQRTDDNSGEEEHDGPVEFTEADIAAQLQLMGDEYGLEPGDYDDGNMDSWPEGTEGVAFSQEDAKFLFKDLLNDFNINPYSPWEKLLEEGKVIDDARYTALSTTKARRECWDEWTREKIAERKEQRAKQEKTDPKVAYMAFLQDKATPKLYWPEFRRKYKKEEPMKDMKLSDKDREKAYREHITRLKMPRATLRSELTALLKAQPVHLLHNKSLSSGLPTQVLTDIRYISLDPEARDPLVEAYVQSLPPPPQDPDAAAEDDAEKRKEREARERRENALRERDRVVEEQKRRREREVAASKARLREGEREIEVAMRVDRRGLQRQLAQGQADAGAGAGADGEDGSS
ncbi:Pre-mRNA-splicing factor dre4 [Tolypocladium paradoxum]|uniref:Pre-mRNA-splicing factor dre4 n=1 Tax=Tolypocladium paradoxum TaxID=94208 RepID=A0A2S4L6A3_9HYPO|nr:Pre-mRNA-splicing factor dre4 [Tolypocladium paradoxum]